jgi:hypothetical protein
MTTEDRATWHSRSFRGPSAVPIRFRCTNCDQLMGIARRKAGSLVRCPACRREIAVPTDADDDSPPIPAPVAAPAPRADLFDRDDFDALLAGGPSLAGARPAPLPVPRPLAEPTEAKARPAGPEPVAVSLVPVQGGLVLSPGWVTTLTVVFLLLLAMAFALGLLVGRHALAP